LFSLFKKEKFSPPQSIFALVKKFQNTFSEVFRKFLSLKIVFEPEKLRKMCFEVLKQGKNGFSRGEKINVGGREKMF
jgi:hypothetical protein